MANFAPLTISNVKMKVDVDNDGNISPYGTKTKYFTIAGISATCSLAESATVFNAFLGTIGGGTFDSLSTVRTITQGVTL